MKFDIEEYKRCPERKLVLRHYRKEQPEVWPVEEIQITIGDRIVIKNPDTGYPTDEYTMLDGDELRDEDHNLVGCLEFASEKLTMSQFVERLMNLPLDCSLGFSCNDNDDGVAFGVTKLKRFDTTLLLFSKYGGGLSQCHDINGKMDAGDMGEFLKCYLEDNYEEYFYMDTANVETELWGVTFEFEHVDGAKLRVLSRSEDAFFASKQGAKRWIANHPYKDFDEDFDNDYCSNPRPVLLDRWSARKDGRVVQLI